MDKSWNPLKLSLKKWSNNHETVKPHFPLSSSLCLYTAISFLPVLFGRRPGYVLLCKVDQAYRCFSVLQPFYYARSQQWEKQLFASSYLSLCPSVRPHGTARPPLDGFSLNMIFDSFSEIYREISSFITGCFPWRTTYIYKNVFLSSSYNEFFQTNIVVETTHILCSITFFLKSCRLWYNVEKYSTGRQARDYNIRLRRQEAVSVSDNKGKNIDTYSVYVLLTAFPQ